MIVEWCAAGLVEGMGRGRFLAGTGQHHLLGADRRAAARPGAVAPVVPGAAEVVR